MASFAEQFGGGEGGPELEEAVNFADAFGPTKQLGEKLWSLIGGKMSFGPVSPVLALRYALIKSALLTMSGGDSKSTLFAQKDINKLTCDSKKEKTVQAG